MTKEEKTNKELIASILKTLKENKHEFEIIPSGCHVEVKCFDLITLDVVEKTLSDVYKERQLDSIRGGIRVTYNKFIKIG